MQKSSKRIRTVKAKGEAKKPPPRLWTPSRRCGIPCFFVIVAENIRKKDCWMDREAQKRAPIYEALERFKRRRVVPFDVPGHKRGRGNPELVQLLGEKCVGLDVNS